ncbi:hypothetical protein [Ornithinimicrobium cerasi]|uniref:hypothetical protein n=1 Tax=Ornithinimicrobium cerasi TaxID=2248773 RepID=UPI00114289C0|nr:hypothetical protein [Ornithinimicrobium cerasi]
MTTALAGLQRDLQAWVLLVDDLADERVLVDQAEDLRRRLRDTAAHTRQLCDTARLYLPDDRDHRTVPVARLVDALVAAATSLHAASHAMSPAASALCHQGQLAPTLSTCGMVATRFLATATRATQDAENGVNDHRTHHVGSQTATPRLRLVHGVDGHR